MITSLTNPTVKLAASLHQKKYRDETGLFLVEGETMIAMAVAQGWQIAHDFILGQNASQEVLAKISKKDNPQPRIAAFKKKPFGTLPKTIDSVLPALEEIRDPGNLGTILRTCHALGLKQLALIGECCDPFAPETIRASMGSFAFVECIAIHTPSTLLGLCKMQQRGANRNSPPSYRLIGTDVVNATDYREVDYTGGILVLGNEQKGLSPELKKACTTNAHIPMPGGTESLNVAMAATLLLYEAMRNRIP